MISSLNKRSVAVVVAAALVSVWLVLSLGNSFDLPRIDVGQHASQPPSDNVPPVEKQPLHVDDKYWKDRYQKEKPEEKRPPPPEPEPEPEKQEDKHEGQASSDENKTEPPAGNENGEGKEEKVAFATFLSQTLDHNDDWEKDNYFIATRILCWQLLHSARTKVTRKNVDVVVMVTPSVSESRRERLKKDGATVYPVDALYADWLNGTNHDKRWDELMAKLRAWQMTQYSRILLLDGDMILQSQLDGIWDDPGAQIQHKLDPKDIKDDKFELPKGSPPLPEKYLLAGIGETTNNIHPFPPTWEDGLQKKGYFNAGFFMLAPNTAMFDYYNHILQTPDSFDPMYMEQNLLNSVHKWEGPLPWKEISYKWNIARVNENDLDKGVVSAHDKWWTEPLGGEQRIRDMFRQVRWEMQGWYDAMDSLEKVKEKETK